VLITRVVYYVCKITRGEYFSFDYNLKETNSTVLNDWWQASS